MTASAEYWLEKIWNKLTGGITVSGGLTDAQLRASDVKVSLDNENVRVVSPPNLVTTPLSGQIAVATAGTAVQGGNVPLTNGVFIRALSGNTGKVYVGHDGVGDVTSANGFELAQGDLILVNVPNLNYLWFDAATNGDKFCWLKG